MTNYNEALRQLNEIETEVLTEMAISRRDALSKVSELAPRFVEHFHKMYSGEHPECHNHWAVEMQAWLDYVLNIKLKETKRPLSLQQKMDWFFTCSSDSETLFKGDELEAMTYDDFIDKVALNNNVRESLQSINLM